MTCACVSRLLTAARAVLDTELAELACTGSMAPCEDALGQLQDAAAAFDGTAQTKSWVAVTRAGQVKKGDKLRFQIGDKSLTARAKLILLPGSDKEEVVYDIGRNFYFITSMVASGRSSHKGVHVQMRQCPCAVERVMALEAAHG